MNRAAALPLLVAVLAITGCSAAPPELPPPPSHLALGDLDPSTVDGNGLWLLSGDDAAAEIVDAVTAAGTVAYTGTFTELTAASPETEPAPGRTLGVDYRGRPGNYAATLRAGDTSIEVIVVDGRTYLRGNAASAAQYGIPELEQGFVCAAAGESLAEQWAPLLRPADLVASLLEASESVSVQPPSGEAELLEVVIGGQNAPAGVMQVQRVGAPLPMSVTAGDSTGDGSFTFNGWGEPTDVTAPTEVVRDCAATD